jgi:hypothetical protein
LFLHLAYYHLVIAVAWRLVAVGLDVEEILALEEVPDKTAKGDREVV